ncbi:Ferritin [Fasciola gigantica]|uniref:Ferritin n=1 Tax=Fasciola gigantica TaxID=46835 RepID=A0A504YQY7_FASGI|nr:Ferritin [Fasciola gigantica]
MLSARVNYPPECEKVVNQTIEFLQSASLTYDLLGATCATEEISMPGFCNFYRLCSLRTRKMSEYLIKWQTMRGGKMNVTQLNSLASSSEFWQQGLEKLVELGVDIEKRIEEQLRYVHKVVKSKEDVATAEYVERKFLVPQMIVIKMMVNHANGLKISGNHYIYDRKSMMRESNQIHHFIKWCSTKGNCEKEKKEKNSCSNSIRAFTYPIV